jgi:hypothetical protein
MPTMKEMEDKRSRLKAEAAFNNPQNVKRLGKFYEATAADTSPAYASANMRANMLEQDMEAAAARKPNSRAQYEHEKAVGGPMSDLSYEEWKKLD